MGTAVFICFSAAADASQQTYSTATFGSEQTPTRTFRPTKVVQQQQPKQKWCHGAKEATRTTAAAAAAAAAAGLPLTSWSRCWYYNNKNYYKYKNDYNSYYNIENYYNNSGDMKNYYNNNNNCDENSKRTTSWSRERQKPWTSRCCWTRAPAAAREGREEASSDEHDETHNYDDEQQ